MIRKRTPRRHANHERWLVSYADFITLLFAFFVVLFDGRLMTAMPSSSFRQCVGLDTR